MSTQPTDVAALATINFYKILSSNAAEQQKLFEAAQSTGIFYLDFSDYSDGVLDALDDMYALSDRYFSQTAEEKEKDVRTDQFPSQDRGYKKSENDETFEIADDELDRGRRLIQLPAAIADKTEQIVRFKEVCRLAAYSLLGSLSQSLAKSAPHSARDDIISHHSRASPSDSGLKLIYEPTVARAADVVENKHTDSGTFTLLFYTEWGLHVLLPSTPKRWAYAAPKPGCALVNVADSLQRLSNGVLHSPLHRVTQHEDGERKRYYLSYFLRPAHELKRQWAREDAETAAAAAAAAAAVGREG